MSKAGRFEIETSQHGYPYWCTIFYEGKQLARVHHSELRDLRYASNKAMREIRTNMRAGVGSKRTIQKCVDEV